jgi:3-methyladenine DNA glycosylase AlkD
MQAEAVLARLAALQSRANVAGMARFGIDADHAYGISAPVLHRLAKEIGRNHPLAQELWALGVREARLLAALIDDPRQVSEDQMERWAADLTSWDVCDCCCSYLFDRTPYAYGKAAEWSARDAEFVKRAGFVLMACLAVHDKHASDAQFLAFLPLIRRESGDDRNMVRKAVNWALRQIGKRNPPLNAAAIAAAEDIRALGSRSGRWIAAHALRELTSEKVQRRLRTRPTAPPAGPGERYPG